MLPTYRTCDKRTVVDRDRIDECREIEMYAVELARDVGEYRARDDAILAEEVGLECDRIHALSHTLHFHEDVLRITLFIIERLERNGLEGRSAERLKKFGGCDVRA